MRMLYLKRKVAKFVISYLKYYAKITSYIYEADTNFETPKNLRHISLVVIICILKQITNYLL